MKTTFIKDLEKCTLEVSREYHANINLVWRAWTEPELLCQWWAPLPWKCESQSMDFKPGGKWVYAMVGPNGEKHFGVMCYHEIKVEQYFKGEDAFCDDKGNINEGLPVANWINTFTPTANGTTVKIFTTYPNKEALQTVLDMGLEQGLNMAIDQLVQLLDRLKTA